MINNSANNCNPPILKGSDLVPGYAKTIEAHPDDVAEAIVLWILRRYLKKND